MDDEIHSDDRLSVGSHRVTPGNGHAQNGRASTFTVRDLLTIGFRHQRLVVLSFVGTFLAAFVFVLLRPPQYESTMTLLVKRARVDPLVSPEASADRPLFPGVTEEELNSEVELLKSRDVLSQVVVAAGLQEPNETAVSARLRRLIWNRSTSTDTDKKIAYAVRQLEGELGVQTLRKSNLIRVSYASPDPALSASILKKLADRYLEKHLAVHRPPGALDFYEQEADRYGRQLTLVQNRLNQQTRDEGVVSVQVERENALRLIGNLEATEQATLADIAGTSERIRVLEAQVASTPARTTTEIRIGSAHMLEELHSTLVTHELKRTELLKFFQPDYPPLQNVEAQIAQLRAAIAEAEKSPVVEETTNRNPTYDSLVSDLAKTRAELAGLRARAAATSENLSAYRHKARRLVEIGMEQQVLVRTATQAEQNYLLYARKREEARTSNALDAQRILNVAVAEEATVPIEPSGPPAWMLLLLGAFAASIVSVGLAALADFLDQSFRTPQEVEAFLDSPVLAVFPKNISRAGLAR